MYLTRGRTWCKLYYDIMVNLRVETEDDRRLRACVRMPRRELRYVDAEARRKGRTRSETLSRIVAWHRLQEGETESR